MKRNYFKIKLVTASFLCIICFLLGIYLGYKNGVFFSNERDITIEISNEKELLHFLNNGQVCTSVNLKNDIRLSSKHGVLGTSASPYQGHFNGMGYTIYIDEAAAASPLFGVLNENAIIENVGLECYSNIEVEERYTLLSERNFGTIKNIRNVFSGKVVFKTAGVYSYICLENYGKISNIISYVYPINSSEDAKPVVYGSVCAYNYGKLESAFAIISEEDYPSRMDILNTSITNHTYGVLYGANFGDVSNLEIPLISHFSGDVYPVYSSDIKDITLVGGAQFFTREHIKNIMNFDSNIWNLETFDLSIINEVLKNENNQQTLELYQKILTFYKGGVE